MNLNDYTHFYFLGAGGIGMSSIARYLNSISKSIYGYDRVRSALCADLESEGIKMIYQDDPGLLDKGLAPENTLVIFTPAIPAESALLNYFKTNQYTLIKRAGILGLITAHGINISVAGTHGKTTTSSLIAHMLKDAGRSFSAFLGGISTNLGSNYYFQERSGSEPVTVTEADEFDRSFLTLSPNLAVVTSMDADHLDIYGDADELKRSFYAFIDKIEPGGTLFLRDGLELPGNTGLNVVTYGLDRGDFYATNIRIEDGFFVFDLKTPELQWNGLSLGIPGLHNIENAVAATGICLELNMSKEQILQGLRSFLGVKRRFEFIIRQPNRIFIDDYAHHPTELSAFIRSVKMLYPDRKITGIFQPHLYSRTRDFAPGFAESLSLLDTVILLDIYPARELPIPGVSSNLIFQSIHCDNKVMCRLSELPAVVRELKPELLLTMGAGDIDTQIPALKETLNGF